MRTRAMLCLVLATGTAHALDPDYQKIAQEVPSVPNADAPFVGQWLRSTPGIRYHIRGFLGSGAFSKVYSAIEERSQSDGSKLYRAVAVKILNVDQPELLLDRLKKAQSAHTELRPAAQNLFQLENQVPLAGSDGKLLPASVSDLYSASLVNIKDAFSEALANKDLRAGMLANLRKMADQLLRATHYSLKEMHDGKVPLHQHGDIKPNNIFIRFEDTALNSALLQRQGRQRDLGSHLQSALASALAHGKFRFVVGDSSTLGEAHYIRSHEKDVFVTHAYLPPEHRDRQAFDHVYDMRLPRLKGGWSAHSLISPGQDDYAVAVTLHTLLTRFAPPLQHNEQFAFNVEANLHRERQLRPTLAGLDALAKSWGLEKGHAGYDDFLLLRNTIVSGLNAHLAGRTAALDRCQKRLEQVSGP